MSDKTPEVAFKLGPVFIWAFWVFVAGKMAGTYIATWSWWWLLMPAVPCIAAIAKWQF